MSREVEQYSKSNLEFEFFTDFTDLEEERLNSKELEYGGKYEKQIDNLKSIFGHSTELLKVVKKIDDKIILISEDNFYSLDGDLEVEVGDYGVKDYRQFAFMDINLLEEEKENLKKLAGLLSNGNRWRGGFDIEDIKGKIDGELIKEFIAKNEKEIEEEKEKEEK